MRTKISNLDTFLRDHGIKASYQRVKIYDYLQNSYSHPSVNQIYTDLHPLIPSLSRATVYNTMNIFLEKQLVISINMEGHEARFDIRDPSHGHFKCTACGQIHDIDLDGLIPQPEQLAGFQIEEFQIHFKGLCPACQARTN